MIRDILADVAEGAQSPLERNYLTDVERAHGLPKGRRQTRSRRGPYIRDVWYDEFKLVVELDGRLGHEALGRFRDMWRDNVHVLEGSGPCATGGTTSPLGAAPWPVESHSGSLNWAAGAVRFDGVPAALGADGRW